MPSASRLLLPLLLLGLRLVMMSDRSTCRGSRSGMSTAYLMTRQRAYSRALGSAAACAILVASARPTAAQINPRRMSDILAQMVP